VEDSTSARHAGKPQTFTAMALLVVVWAAAGPYFGYSDTWQLTINTGTTILTFLMVFLIQATQNRDAEAIQIKLDELIRCLDNAHNSFSPRADAHSKRTAVVFAPHSSTPTD
jgi:low affinity Fe/Cu permease